MTIKIAVSLPDELVAQAKAAVVAGRADSVSGYVAEALAARGHQESLAAVLDRLDAELGAPSPDAVSWARAALEAVDQ